MITIRTMHPDEVDAVCRVDREAFRSSRFGALTGLQDRAPEEFEQWQSVHDFRAYCTRHPDRVLVAVEDDRIAGFAIFDYSEEEQAGRVYSCALLPAFRGRGTGVSLVKRLIEELRARGARRAEVRTTHVPRACRMYEKAGFELVERRTKQADDGTHYDCSRYQIDLSR